MTLSNLLVCDIGLDIVDIQSINTNRRANNDWKAKASHCAPVSTNSPVTTPNNAITQSGCIALPQIPQIVEKVSTMADQNGPYILFMVVF